MSFDLIGERTTGGVFEENVLILFSVFNSVIMAETFDDIRGSSKAIEYLLLVFQHRRGVNIGGFDGGGRRKMNGSICGYGYVDGGEAASAERVSANPNHGYEQCMCVFSVLEEKENKRRKGCVCLIQGIFEARDN